MTNEHLTPPPLWLIFTLTVVGISAVSVVAPILPDIMHGLSASPSSAGLIMAVVSLPGIVTAPMMGVTADRMGRRTAITLCLLLAGVGGLCAGFSSQMSTLLIFRLIQGIGSAGLVYLPMVLIGDHWEGSQRSRYIGWNAATLTAAIALTPFLSGLIAGIWSWRSSFVLFGSALIMVYPAMRWLPNRRVTGSGLREQWIGAMPVLKSPHVLTVMALAVLLFMIVFGIKYTTLPVSLSIDYGLPPSTRGLLLSIPAITSTFGGLMMGRIHNRIGKISTLAVGFVCYGIATILFSTTPSLTVLIIAAVIFGVGDGTALPTLDEAMAGAGPSDTRGTVVSVYGGSIRIGQTLGPLGAGSALASVGIASTFMLGGVIVAVGFAIVLVAQVRGWMYE